MAAKGYEGVSLQEIAHKVGLHKSSLFHYFKNKEELLLRILEGPIDETASRLKKIITNNELEPEELLKMAIYSHLVMITQNMDNVNIYLNEVRSLSRKKRSVHLAKMKRYEEHFSKIVCEMKKKGYFRGLNTRVVTFGILGMLNWTVKWYKKDGSLDVKRIADDFCGIVFGSK
jgi:AcrR family transcriptional regulator